MNRNITILIEAVPAPSPCGEGWGGAVVKGGF